MKPVRDIRINSEMTANDIINSYGDAGGFTAKKLAVATNIVEAMLKDQESVTFLSFPADIIATGVRGVIASLLKEKLVDVVITTCGTLDHDLARVWEDYYHGDFLADDVKLRRKGINRLGNIFVPNESYGIILEKKLQPIFSSIFQEKKEVSTKELIWDVGEKLGNEVERENSIVYQAYKNKIPIFVPGPFDGAFGYQLWLFWQMHKDLKLNLFLDEQDLSDIVYSNKRSGAIILGGGISKHHTIWWNQFKDGLNYAVYITTAQEWDGSLSGARLREAISWGKVNEKAKHQTVEGDITVIFPFMIAAVYERLYGKKRKRMI
ncbi:MAG: deoxyhypusine synthase [Thermoprotei archaeon]